jgi:hypothetical protein
MAHYGLAVRLKQRNLHPLLPIKTKSWDSLGFGTLQAGNAAGGRSRVANLRLADAARRVAAGAAAA